MAKIESRILDSAPAPLRKEEVFRIKRTFEEYIWLMGTSLGLVSVVLVGFYIWLG